MALFTGTKVLEELLVRGKKNELHTLISRIADGSDISIHLHQKMGFRTIGVMKEVGRKFGNILDITLMQKML